MKVYRDGQYLVIRFGRYVEYECGFGLPFWLSRLGEFCIGLDLFLAFYFISPQIAEHSGMWNIQLPIIVWTLLGTLLAAGILFRSILGPYIQRIARKEAEVSNQKFSTFHTPPSDCVTISDSYIGQTTGRDSGDELK